MPLNLDGSPNISDMALRIYQEGGPDHAKTLPAVYLLYSPDTAGIRDFVVRIAEPFDLQIVLLGNFLRLAGESGLIPSASAPRA